MPRLGTPHAQAMALHCLRTRPLKLDRQVAQESSMPPIAVALEEAISLLEGKEVEDEGAKGRRVANLLVENARVGWCEDAVCAVGQFADDVNDCVSCGFEAEAVGEGVDVQQRVVGGPSIFEGRGEYRGVEPGDEELEVRDVDVVEGDCVGGGFEKGAGECGAEVRGLTC